MDAQKGLDTGERSRRSVGPADCPSSDHDLYSAESLVAPYEHYRTLRDLGGVVYLQRYGIYALPRYETTHAALSDWKRFSSHRGVMLNDVMDDFMEGSLLCSDPPEHDTLRSVIMRPLKPKALREIQPEIATEAEGLVARLCAQGSFDAATELAQYLPTTIVSNKVGLPPVEKASMLRWTPAAFDCAGPIDVERTRASFAVLAEIGAFVGGNGARDQIAKNSWLEGIYQAADEGIIPHDKCPSMAIDYIGPALDTTISATSSAIYLFTKYPEQWDRIRAQPSLIPNAINEIVRCESPIQGWGRRATEDVTIGGATIPAGAKVLVMFGSANRDERKWPDPETFDVKRKVNDQVGFGHGEHGCAGANLARLEITALLTALAKRVTRFEFTGEPELAVNNVARLWKTVPVRAILDQE